MSASWMPQAASFDAQLAWYTRLATTPGWWAYAQDRVRTLEADPTGRYRGLHAQVAAQVKALGYRPAPEELGRWWDCPSQAERWRNVIVMPFDAKTRCLPAELLNKTAPQGLERMLATLRDKPMREGEAGPSFGRASSGNGPAPDFAPAGGSGFDDMQDIPF